MLKLILGTEYRPHKLYLQEKSIHHCCDCQTCLLLTLQYLPVVQLYLCRGCSHSWALVPVSKSHLLQKKILVSIKGAIELVIIMSLPGGQLERCIGSISIWGLEPERAQAPLHHLGRCQYYKWHTVGLGPFYSFCIAAHQLIVTPPVITVDRSPHSLIWEF